MGVLVLVLIALAVLLLPTGVLGQPMPELSEGQEIRIWAPRWGLRNRSALFLEWGDSALVLSHSQVSSRQPIPFDDITRLDLFDRRSAGMGALRGGTIGFLVVGVAGAIRTQCEPNEQHCGLARFYYGGLSGLVGGLIGAIVGSQFPMAIWTRQELPWRPD